MEKETISPDDFGPGLMKHSGVLDGEGQHPRGEKQCVNQMHERVVSPLPQRAFPAKGRHRSFRPEASRKIVLVGQHGHKITSEA